MTAPDRERRRLLAGAAGLALTAYGLRLHAAEAATLRATLPMQAGPFYPREIPLDHDNDLLRVTGSTGRARGTPLALDGSVVDRRGRALSGVRVEIWQCDADGHYHHVGGAGGDRGFQGYGTCVTDAGGAWRFRTIRPVPYTSRTPHIHFKLRGEGFDGLATQLFVKDDPGNAGDWIYNSLPTAERAALEVALGDGGDGTLRGHFRIVLDADGRFARESPLA